SEVADIDVDGRLDQLHGAGSTGKRRDVVEGRPTDLVAARNRAAAGERVAAGAGRSREVVEDPGRRAYRGLSISRDVPRHTDARRIYEVRELEISTSLRARQAVGRHPVDEVARPRHDVPVECRREKYAWIGWIDRPLTPCRAGLIAGDTSRADQFVDPSRL